MVNRLVAVDDADYKLPDPVLAALSVDVADEATVVGAATKDAVLEHAERKNGTIVRARDHLSGSGDLTSATQALVSSLNAGDTLVFDSGTWRIDGTITIAQSDITITLNAGSTWDRSAGTAAISAIVSTGARFTLDGTGTILSPASWNGTNVTWTYAVVLCSGEAPHIRNIKLQNVNKVGIGFKEATGTSTVDSVTIIGNYPAAQWTGVETVHFGITHDPSLIGSKLKATRNVIKSCVQGICLGNFGTGSSIGTIMTENDFEGCHNHALYNSGGFVSAVFSNNTITNCQQPIVMTGNGHQVIGNTMKATGTGNSLHTTCNIQMRESSNGVVSGNTMEGDVWTSVPGGAGSPAIEFLNVPASGVNVLRNNVCSGNTIKISATNSAIGIRVGSANTVTNENNIISGNVIEGGGTSDQAAIVVAGNATTRQQRAQVSLNTIHLTKVTSGIFIYGSDHAIVTHNTVYFDADAASSTVVGGIRVGGTSSKTYADGNRFILPSTKGTNITLRGIYEEAGTVGNIFSNDGFDISTTLLTAFTPHFLQITSGVTLNECLPGAPAVVAAPGSTWRRTDGGAGATLYIKESAANLATWRAI